MRKNNPNAGVTFGSVKPIAEADIKLMPRCMFKDKSKPQSETTPKMNI